MHFDVSRYIVVYVDYLLMVVYGQSNEMRNVVQFFHSKLIFH